MAEKIRRALSSSLGGPVLHVKGDVDDEIIDLAGQKPQLME